MKLDDKVLEEIVFLIKKYCVNQHEVLNKFYNNMRKLEDDWIGSKFDEFISTIEYISSKGKKEIDKIETTYIPFYKKNIEMINSRPAFRGGTVSNTSSNISTSSSSNNKNTFFNNVFNKYNKEFKDKIFTLLRKVIFCNIDTSNVYYDPNGESKRRLKKNIIAINLNSPTFEQDLLSLTGQLLFFQMKEDYKNSLSKKIEMDMNNSSFSNNSEYITFVETIKNGAGINDQYMHFNDNNLKMTFNYFSKVFQKTLVNDVNEITKYKKYFPTSYVEFMNIMQNVMSYK